MIGTTNQGGGLQDLCRSRNVSHLHNNLPYWTRSTDWPCDPRHIGHLKLAQGHLLPKVDAGTLWHIILESCIGSAAAKPPRLRNVTSYPVLGNKPQGLVMHMINNFTKEDYDMVIAGLNSITRVEDGVVTMTSGSAPDPEHVEIKWLIPERGP